MGLVDCACGYAEVRGSSDFRVAAIWVVADITKDFGFVVSYYLDERGAAEGDYYLAELFCV